MEAAAIPVPEDDRDMDDEGEATPKHEGDVENAPEVMQADPPAQVPVQETDHDVIFWKRMQSMMDAQTNRLEHNIMMVNDKVGKVQVRLEERIDKESTERRREAADTAAKVDDLATRVAKLEMGADASPTLPQQGIQPARSDGWTPNFIVWGGFPEDMQDAQKHGWVLSILHEADIQENSHLMQFTPPRSQIVKVKFENSHVANRALFTVQRTMEKRMTASQTGWIVWAALERPPEVAYRRKVLSTAAEEIAKYQPGMQAPTVQYAAGEVLLGGQVLLRTVAGRLVAGEAWGSQGPTSGRTWTPRPLARGT